MRERHRKAVSPSGTDPQAVSDDKAEARAVVRSKEYQQLRQVPYAELLALNEHLGGGTPFATQHGVKGLEFNRALAVVSKGHPRFQIPEMLANFSRRDELMDKELGVHQGAQPVLRGMLTGQRAPGHPLHHET
ncbi:hypothetical protein JQK87_06645 [Streptomyces sp. G44]|uniref:hypothetical protein n=1 Tax=Streptomyces sp. G44 TaxID=2807632 RepID=UPI001961A6DD|nr:hypothetical protein [Streptomyces sp. G44]MBM7168095.1 hypothetical protein [Streptomyces sp. G44]